MNVALLPLDDRPVCLELPGRIAAICGAAVLTPPPEQLGCFLQAGDRPALGEWLLEASSRADALVVAVDMLCFGGLIASRSPRVTQEDALTRLARLSHLKARYPRLRLLAASVIMRATITQSGPETEGVYEDMARFTALREQARTDASLRAELARLQARIPAAVIETFDAARLRNHAVNLACIDLVAAGVIERLLLLQEDCQPEGPQRREQASLLERAESLGVLDAIHLHPGADEGAAVLVARAVCGDAPMAFELLASSAAGLARVAPFEDRPLAETIAGQARSLALRQTATGAGPLLLVHTPGATRAEIDASLDALQAALDAGRRVYVADVATPNGADPRLAGPLAARGLWPRLTGYAGWNTAGNSIGTVLATLRAAEQDAGTHQAAERRLLAERFHDDWTYQRALRPWLNGRLERAGLSPVHLDAAGVADATSDLNSRGLTLSSRLATLAGLPPVHSWHLPWPRTFEARVQLRPEAQT